MGRVARFVDLLGQPGQCGLHPAPGLVHASLHLLARVARLGEFDAEAAVVVGQPTCALQHALDALLERLQFVFHGSDGRDSPPQGQADGRVRSVGGQVEAGAPDRVASKE